MLAEVFFEEKFVEVALREDFARFELDSCNCNECKHFRSAVPKLNEMFFFGILFPLLWFVIIFIVLNSLWKRHGDGCVDGYLYVQCCINYLWYSLGGIIIWGILATGFIYFSINPPLINLVTDVRL